MLNRLKCLVVRHPHTWTTLKFGSLFAGSELSQQLIIKKIWYDKEFRIRKWLEQEPLDWANIGTFAYNVVWG